MGDETADAFTYNGGRVDPGESQNIRYSISETYLGDPVRIPVTVINGGEPGPTVFLSAASHGDELNGIEVVREVSLEWDLSELRGTLVCMPVLNVPGFLFQERYLPIYDRDLNRSFPGSPDGTSARRMANQIFSNFVKPCDLGIDFHTSTRGRTNMLHVRGDLDDPDVERLAFAFGSHVIIDSTPSGGTLRREATDAGVPTITIEMGEAHRFQRPLIDKALDGVASALMSYDALPGDQVRWPGWRTVIESGEKTWLRADAGGLVEMHHESGDLVEAGGPSAPSPTRSRPTRRSSRRRSTACWWAPSRTRWCSPATRCATSRNWTNRPSARTSTRASPSPRRAGYSASLARRSSSESSGDSNRRAMSILK